MFCGCQEVQPSSTDENKVRGKKKRRLDNLCRKYIIEKWRSFVEKWECQWREKIQQKCDIKKFMRADFPFECPLDSKALISQIRSGKLFAYVQCKLQVHEHLMERFHFFSIFKTQWCWYWSIHDSLRRREHFLEAISKDVNFQFPSA